MAWRILGVEDGKARARPAWRGGTGVDEDEGAIADCESLMTLISDFRRSDPAVGMLTVVRYGIYTPHLLTKGPLFRSAPFSIQC